MGKCGLLDVSNRSFLSLSGFLLILNLFQQLKTKNVSSFFSGSFAPVIFLLYIFFIILWFLFIKERGHSWSGYWYSYILLQICCILKEYHLILFVLFVVVFLFVYVTKKAVCWTVSGKKCKLYLDKKPSG